MISGQWESWIGLSSASPRTSESEIAIHTGAFSRVTQCVSVPWPDPRARAPCVVQVERLWPLKQI